MTVYEFLLHAARSYSGVVNGGKTEDIRIDLETQSIWSERLCIMREGRITSPTVRLENGDTCRLDGLIDFEGDAYTEIERLYAQYKRSVPNRHVKLNKGYFKALCSDSLTMQELMDNMPRPEARLALEGFVLLASLAGLIPWHDPAHFFWQSPTDPDCIVYRDWIMVKGGAEACRTPSIEQNNVA